jgi:uncharacterized protein
MHVHPIVRIHCTTQSYPFERITIVRCPYLVDLRPPDRRPRTVGPSPRWVAEGRTSDSAARRPGTATGGTMRGMSEVPARLSIVTLGARDMGVLRAFYRSLGWPELSTGDETWTGFLLGGVLLALFPIGDLTAEAAPGSPEPTGWAGVTLACAVDERADVDAVFARAVAAGATPVADATDRPWGGRSAFVADPEGNRWEITWGPAAGFDARGSLLSWG